MINHRPVQFVIVVSMAICLITQSAAALNLYDSDYKAEVYATFSSSGMGWLNDIAFDPQGNLYFTSRGSGRDTTDGAVYRVDTQGNISSFATGFYAPGGIVWGGGQDFGENLYVADSGSSSYGSGGGIKRIDLNGNVTHFASPYNQPYAITLDQTGNYGNRLYTATRGLDHIDAVLSDGSTQLFSDFPYNMSGGPKSLAFDLTGKYGNSMFIANEGSGYSGIYKMDTIGNASRFAPEISKAVCLGFDSDLVFDGDMFVSGKQVSDYYNSIFRASKSQDVIKFADVTGAHLTWFEFGPDGALYALENDRTNGIITRITPVPEPASILLLSFGAVLLRKRQSFYR